MTEPAPLRMRLVAAALAALLAALLRAPGALAGEDASVTATVSPQTLSGAGAVTLTVTVTCPYNAVYPMDDTQVVRGSSILCSFGQITMDETKTRQATLNVAEGDLGRPIPLTLAWTEDGTPKTRDFSVIVERTGAAPVIEFSRSLPAVVVRLGDDVLVTYFVRNAGSVDVADLKISDPGVGPVGSLDRLAVGSAVWKTVVTHVMTGAFSSNPTLTYAAGDHLYATTLEAIPVELARTELTAALEIDKSHAAAGEPVRFMCAVANTGNMDLLWVEVSESGMGSLGSFSNLAPGETRVFEYDTVVSQTAEYTFTVTGSDGSGTEVSAETNTVTVTVEEQSDVLMAISAACDLPELDGPGDASIRLTVENLGSAALEGVRVIDQDGLVVHTFGTLPPGRQTLLHSVYLESGKAFIFKLSLTMPDGTLREVASNPIEIKVGDPGATPEPTGVTVVTEATPKPGSQGGGMSPELRAILAAIGLIAAALVVLVALMVRDRERSVSQRAKRRR